MRWSDSSPFWGARHRLSSDATNRIRPLDGLRGVAAGMVIVFHLWQAGFTDSFGLTGAASRIFAFGQTGVDLFFVLSGFLITRILLATKSAEGYFGTFYTRRILRIFPLYYLGLLIYYFALPVVLNKPFVPASQQWWFWLYLQNIPMTFKTIAADGPNHFGSSWNLVDVGGC